MKPVLGKNYQDLGPYSKHIFDNPILENFVTSYMEETQETLNDCITFEQFKGITWTNGMPCFILDLLAYLTGCSKEILEVFEALKGNLQKLAQDDHEHLVRSQT